MSAITPIEGPSAQIGAPAPRTRGPFIRRGAGPTARPAAWRWTIILIVALVYLVPILASIKFSLEDRHGHYNLSNYSAIFNSSTVRASALQSIEIAAIVAIASVQLMVPTVVLVRLKFPRLTFLMEVVTILPIVIPPIVITAALQQMHQLAPLWVVKLLFSHAITALAPFYLIFTLPLMYRSVDTGVRAIDLHTLVDASRSLGAGWTSTMVRVILPNIQTAVLGGAFLSLALCLGEVVLANGLSALTPINTYPVEMIVYSQQNQAPGVATAMTLIAFVFTFLLLFVLTFLTRRRGVRATRLV